MIIRIWFVENPKKQPQRNLVSVMDRLQISLLISKEFKYINELLFNLNSSVILNEFKRINKLLFPLKSSENLWFFDDFRGNRS